MKVGVLGLLANSQAIPRSVCVPNFFTQVAKPYKAGAPQKGYHPKFPNSIACTIDILKCVDTYSIEAI